MADHAFWPVIGLNIHLGKNAVAGGIGQQLEHLLVGFQQGRLGGITIIRSLLGGYLYLAPKLNDPLIEIIPVWIDPIGVSAPNDDGLRPACGSLAVNLMALRTFGAFPESSFDAMQSASVYQWPKSDDRRSGR